MTTVRTALIQMSTVYDKEANTAKGERLVRQAADQGAQIVCLQELFNTIYFPYEMDPRHLDLAEPIPGPTTDRMQELAREVGVVLVAPIYEKTIEGMLFNTAPVIGADGELLGIYRKSHIPLVSTPTLTGIEKYYFAPGDTGFVTFGRDSSSGSSSRSTSAMTAISPEGVRAFALQGAQLMVVPTATTGMSRYLWELELRAHAVDNIMYVGGVNRVGVDRDGSDSHFYGSSVWVDPKGRIINQASDQDDEVLVADLDFSVVPQIRNEWGFFRDRRPDLYGAVAT